MSQAKLRLICLIKIIRAFSAVDETLAATQPEDPHRVERSHWLRAAVLGATDGIVF